MKLSIADFYYDTTCWLNVAQRYAQFAKAGFSCVDFNTAKTDFPLYTVTEAELTKVLQPIKMQLSDAGLTVSQVHGPWCWPPAKDMTPEGRIVRAGEMKRSILIAHLLGAKNWVVHPIMPHGVRDIPEGNTQQTWDLNAEFMSWLVAYGKELDVTVCLENMPFRNFSMARPESVLKLVKELNDPHFKICLDTGHAAIFPDHSLEEYVCMLADQIRAFHIHDNGGEKDEHLFPGKGVIDWQGFARGLKAIHYQGVFSLETCPPDASTVEEFEKGLNVLAGVARDIIAQTA